jgi:peptidoglycan/xylan/chitin deacetylase (PgdA/CDA1 family)
LKRSSSFLIALLLTLTIQNAFPRTGGNLYRIMMDDEGVPLRLVFVRSLKEKAPEPFLLDNLGYENPALVKKRNLTIIYERRNRGRIPVLCFHRIGADQRYELTLPRVHELMKAMVQSGYYPVRDRDFAEGNLAMVPSGMKPVVMGADDAGATQLLWDKRTLEQYGPGRHPLYYILEPDCLASVFAQYFAKSGGHYNFTFYASFDAIPFRQTGPLPNKGMPYENMPVVGDKLRYAYDEYHLGYHSLSHTYIEDMTIEAFVREIEESSRILSDYFGRSVRLPSLAFPYGAGRLTARRETELRRAILKERLPAVGFDLDGEFSVPPWEPGFRSWDISRFSVENRSFDQLMGRLSSPGVYTSRRTILLRSENKRLRLDDLGLSLGKGDRIYVYIP